MFTLASKIRAAIMNDDVAALEKLAAGHDAAKLSVWEGHSGLYTAARKGRPQAARFFLDKGGDPNKNEGYWTPLQCAAYYGRLEIVAMMLKKDGNPNLRDNNEKNARDLAEGRGFRDVVTLLTPYMKDPLAALMPQVAALLPAPEKPAALKAGDTWSLLAEDTAAHVFGSGDTGYRITEIFNFNAEVYTRIAENTRTQAESNSVKTFDDLHGSPLLEQAYEAFRAKGGRTDLYTLDKPRPPPALQRGGPQ